MSDLEGGKEGCENKETEIPESLIGVDRESQLDGQAKYPKTVVPRKKSRKQE